MQLFHVESVAHAMSVQMADGALSQGNFADVDMLHDFIFLDRQAAIAGETRISAQHVAWLGQVTARAAVLDMVVAGNPHDKSANLQRAHTVWQDWQTGTEPESRQYSQLNWAMGLDKQRHVASVFPLRFSQLFRRLALADTLSQFSSIIAACIERGQPSHNNMAVQMGRQQVYTIDWPQRLQLPHSERHRRKYKTPLITPLHSEETNALPVSRLSLRLPGLESECKQHYELQLIDTHARGGAMCRSRTIIASNLLLRTEDAAVPPAERHIEQLAAQMTTTLYTKDGFPGGLPVVLEAGQQDVGRNQYGVLEVMERFITL